jgi:acyl-coenzyme A thioesterase PaaI-like protein
MQKNSVPAGFESIDLGAGFMHEFGPVYLYRASRTLGFRVAAHHLNPVGACNGGAMATFADMQIAAVRSGPGTAEGHAPTISLSVDYLAPAPLGAWAEAAVTLVKSTRTLIFTQALITVDGEAVARSSAIYRIYQ